VYRYYNGKEHFYTQDGMREINTIDKGSKGNFGYVCEGIAFYAEPDWSDKALPVYRYWNGTDHFYTQNGAAEMKTIKKGEKGQYGFTCEGLGFHVYTNDMNGEAIPLYRYYNGKEHFYTTDGDEIGVTEAGKTGKFNYKCEGVVGYVKEADDQPVYRYFNGTEHFYTTSEDEIGTTIEGETGKGGYKFEKVAFYTFDPNLSDEYRAEAKLYM